VVVSEKVPTAVNCCNTPSGIEEFAGVTAIDNRVAFVTVIAAVPETVPEVWVKLAVMVAGPAIKPLTVPFVGTVSLIEATVGAEEVQVTLLVMFCVLPSA
jgi:hypothetical protein